ncbi:MAG TPA: hypothetical protein VI461_02790 [Chitinophagaceae bacterium]|nr:hypothetical protein [Chitinophagaceae bacterium]
MNLVMPKEGPPIDLGLSNAMTILLDEDDHVYYYMVTGKQLLQPTRFMKQIFLWRME